MCWDEYRGKPELSWQLKLVRDEKSNYRDIGSKKTTIENMGSLLNVVCAPVTKGRYFSAIKERFFCAWDY